MLYNKLNTFPPHIQIKREKNHHSEKNYQNICVCQNFVLPLHHKHKTFTTMGKLKAPLDGKNVTTDWIGDVFDNCEYTIDGQSIVGFIGHSPVFAVWDDNYIVWKCILNNENCMELLEKRLAAYEDDENSNICSECTRMAPMLLIQSFYFKEDNL